MTLSEKQKAFTQEKSARINLLEGAVRSGKTVVSLIKFALFVASMPKDAEFLMVGKTVTTLRRNCLGLLQELEPSFRYNLSTKKASLYGRTIWLEGANNERAEDKIRGMTLAGVYIDELSLTPKGFYYMALSRLSYRNAKLFATTNPESPSNYVFTDIICNEDIDKAVTKFLIRDNPYLDPEYVEALEREYKGVFYQRYILGEWVLAEGLVYPMFDNKVSTISRNYTEYCVGVDYGIMNPTAMLLFGYCKDDGIWYCVDEYYYNGRATGVQKTDTEYYDALEKLCEGKKINYVYVDPSAASFIALIRQHGKFLAHKAENTVFAGIQNTASCLATKKIMINDCCKNTLREFGLYSWNDKAQTDEVIKENDHAMDALRYFVQSRRVYRQQANYRPILG